MVLVESIMKTGVHEADVKLADVVYGVHKADVKLADVACGMFSEYCDFMEYTIRILDGLNETEMARIDDNRYRTDVSEMEDYVQTFHNGWKELYNYTKYMDDYSGSYIGSVAMVAERKTLGKEDAEQITRVMEKFGRFCKVERGKEKLHALSEEYLEARRFARYVRAYSYCVCVAKEVQRFDKKSESDKYVFREFGKMSLHEGKYKAKAEVRRNIRLRIESIF